MNTNVKFHLVFTPEWDGGVVAMEAGQVARQHSQDVFPPLLEGRMDAERGKAVG